MADEEYGVLIGDPYLWTDYNGKHCILQEETIFSTDSHGRVNSKYTTEKLIDPNPSEAKVFKFILAGDVKINSYKV